MKHQLRIGFAALACATLMGTGLAGTASAAGNTTGRIADSGAVTTGTLYDYAELSGITRAGGQTLVVNDKTPQKDLGRAVLTLPGQLAHGQQAEPLTALPDLDVQKLEGITTSPDGGTVFATTAFDRAPGKFSNYNVLVSWPTDDPAAATVLGSTQAEPTYSLALRDGIAKALGNPGFFKIEGVTATQDKLLLGVREVGPDYTKADYVVKILSVGYSVSAEGSVELIGNPELVWEMPAEQSAGLPKGPIGLSDLAFDPSSRSVLMTTSYENARSDSPDAVAGYLWRLDLADLGGRTAADPVTGQDGKPLMFTHKAEGVMAQGNSIVVLHDDDKRPTTVTTPAGDRVKQPNEAPFDIVTGR